VASPLELWMLRAVYIEGRRNPQPLIDPDLLNKLIPAAYRRHPDASRRINWTSDQAER